MVEPLPWPRPRQSPCPMKVDLQGQGSAVLSWTTLGGRSGSLPPPEPPLRAALHQAIMVVLPSACPHRVRLDLRPPWLPGPACPSAALHWLLLLARG